VHDGAHFQPFELAELGDVAAVLTRGSSLEYQNRESEREREKKFT
jgi:hypothetical protein